MPDNDKIPSFDEIMGSHDKSDVPSFEEIMGEPVKKKESTTSTHTLSPFGEELRKGLSTRAVSESTKVKPDQTEKRKDIEFRAAKTKDEAIKNTLKAYKNRISGDGLYAISDDSPTLQKHKKELEEGLASGDYQIIKSPTTNKQILARKDNFLNSLQGAINSAYDKSQEDVYFSNLSPEEKVKHIEAQKLKQDEWLPSAPSGLGGGIGTAIGENIGGLVKASYYGTLFASGAGELGLTAEALQGAEKLGAAISFIKDMGFSGYTDNAKHTYEKLRQQDPKGDKVEQMKHAEKAGLIGEGTGVLTAGLMGGAFSKLKSASAGIELSGMAKSMESMAKHTVKEANAMGGYQALSSIVSDLGASSQGVKFDAGETLEKAGESYKSGAEMVAIMSGGMALLSGAIQIPKYVESQIKGTISKLPREDVKNVYQAGEQNGIFPEGTTSKVMGDLDEFDFALNKISKDIPDEHRNAIAGLQVKINRLDRMKESLSEAEHPRIDELTNKLKERQQTILKSENFLKGEVDEVTGVPATDKPIEPTPPSKDDLTPVITVDGKEYEGDNHGEAMDKAIADGKDIPDKNTPEGKIWREENGQFRENNIPNSIPLTRNETEAIYGIRNSEDLLDKKQASEENPTEVQQPTEVEKPITEKVDETKPTTEEKSIHNEKLDELDKKAKDLGLGANTIRDLNSRYVVDISNGDKVPDGVKELLEEYSKYNENITSLKDENEISNLNEENFSKWVKSNDVQRDNMGKVIRADELDKAAQRIRILNNRGLEKQANSELESLKGSNKKDNWTIESYKDRFGDDLSQKEIDDINKENKSFNDKLQKSIDSVSKTKETIPNKETELPKEKEKPKTEKPKIKLEFVEPKKLAEKGDALANKEEHDRIKESHKSLRKIIDCLWK